MVLGVHPLVVDDLRHCGDGDVFLDEREMDTGDGGAGG